MRLEYRAEVEVKKKNSKKVQVSVIHKKSYHLYKTAFFCGLTGILYGGWCWTYAFQPFKDEYNDMRSSSKRLIAETFKSGFKIIDYDIRRISWIESPMFFSTSESEPEYESDYDGLDNEGTQKPDKAYE